MQLSFLGAAREVGRSCIHVQGRHSLLLDCGVKLKGDTEDFPLLDAVDLSKLDTVALSHAHLDHSGYLPALYARGYKGPVAASKPTRDLTQLLLADYLRLNPKLLPFSQANINEFLKHIELLEYGEWDALKLLRFSDAGHVLGSGMVEVAEEKKILYTGDFCLRPSRLLPGADVNALDTQILITESTYGGEADSHPSSKELANALCASVQKTLDKGGKVLIPTFAIGRGQEVLFILESFMRSGHLEKVPIFIDGMVNTALRIHRHNAVYLKDEVKRRILTSEEDPFKSPFYVTPQTKDRSDVMDKEKAIIVAPSGMLNGGPALFYLKALAGSSKNKVLLTGYQAEGTLGRKLIEGAKSVVIDGDTVNLKLEVDQARISAHADRVGLLDVVRKLPRLEHVFLVHGEEKKAEELQEAMQAIAKKQKRAFQVHLPSLGETVQV